MKRCPNCKIVKSIDLFDKNISNKDGLQSQCKKCRSEKAKDYFQRKKESLYKQRSKYRKKKYKESNGDYLLDFKKRNTKYALKRKEILKEFLSEGCVVCGEKDPTVLEFDHLQEKLKGIANISNKKELLNEVKKCQILCCNCHRRKTAKERKFWKTWWTEKYLNDSYSK